MILTHHHYDHVDGLPDLLAQAPAKVIGAADDAHRLPPLDLAVQEGDSITIGNETGHILDVSGHTIGHIAIHFPDSKLVFTADSLMALGCGRVFEGSMPQMHESLQKLATLPPETIVCSGHEYTESNARFALSIDSSSPALLERVEDIRKKRATNTPTVPSLLSDELATNPFLRTHDPVIRKNLNMETGKDTEIFAEIRARKDSF